MPIEQIVAPNPGLMTGPGTNTWIAVSGGESVVIDPGPMIEKHMERVIGAIAGTIPIAVLITHTHPDHAPAANPLAALLGVPAMGRSDGPDFVADRRLADGDVVTFGDSHLAAVATPGHTLDSTCFRLGDELFTGDHIMGGSTVVVEDMAAYMASLELLVDVGLTRMYPGHGPVIDDPDRVVVDYVAHRRAREHAIAAAVDGGADSVEAIVETVYRDVDRALHPVAAVSVAAHLRKLIDEERVAARILEGFVSPLVGGLT